jgi:Fe-S-cluster containining protein
LKAILHVPEGIRYTCHNSGVCCSTFPHIPVDENSVAAMRSGDLARTGVASIDEAIEPDPAGKDPPHLCRRPDGACVFYGEDHLCELHRVIGIAAKPNVCREFPFRYRETPGGVYVGLSFVCPSVRGNRGALLTDQRANLEQAYPRAYAVSKVEGPILLNSRVQVSWEGYLDVEQSFYELLERDDQPLEVRLIALNVLINFVDTYFRRIHAEAPSIGEARLIGDEELAGFLKALRATNYADLLRVAGKRVTAHRLRRMFQGMITGFGNTLFHKRGRTAAVAGVAWQYARHAVGLGSVRLSPLAQRVPHRHLARTRFPREGEALELLVRYTVHSIFRKDLMYRMDVLRGVNQLILNAALIQWYAAGEAANHGRSEPVFDDWSEAIGHVEKLYGFHSRLYQFLSEYPSIDALIDSFMVRKNYPFVLLPRN